MAAESAGLAMNRPGSASGEHRSGTRLVGHPPRPNPRWAPILVLLCGACGGEAGPGPGPASITVQPGADLVTAIGAEAQFTALVRDETGAIVTSAFVVWRSVDRSVVTIDPNEGLATAVGPGVTTIRASSGSVVGTALIEVYLEEPTGPFVAGETYFGRAEYVEYQAGNLPIIISAPHGGAVEPEEIADRTVGTGSPDANTEEVARRMAAAIATRTGGVPHLIISHLHRAKLDPNREIIEAAQGNPFAELAWNEYHRFLEVASIRVGQAWGSGLYADIHGHAHELQRLELGYLLTADQLALAPATLEGLAASSSIRAAANASDSTFVAVLRGPTSLGGLLEDEGYAVVPGPATPTPSGTPYFSGGYSTETHGSRNGGSLSAVHIELHMDGIRDDDANRQTFAAALTRVIETFLAVHMGIDWTP